MIRFSWLLTRSLSDLISFKISSSLASDFCGRHKRWDKWDFLDTFVLISCCESQLQWHLHTNVKPKLCPLPVWKPLPTVLDCICQVAGSGTLGVNMFHQHWNPVGCDYRAELQRHTWAGSRAGGCVVGEVRQDAQQPAGAQRSSRPLSLWVREWVEEHLQTTSRRQPTICPCFKCMKFVCLTLGAPERRIQRDEGALMSNVWWRVVGLGNIRLVVHHPNHVGGVFWCGITVKKTAKRLRRLTEAYCNMLKSRKKKIQSRFYDIY